MRVPNGSSVVRDDDGFDEGIVCHIQSFLLVTLRGSCEGFQYVDAFTALGGYCLGVGGKGEGHILTLAGGVTVISLHAILNVKYV